MRHYLPNPQSSIATSSAAERYQSFEYKAIFKTLLIGSIALVTILTFLLLVSFFALNNTYVAGRIFVCGGALLFLAATYVTWARKHYAWASRMLIAFYYTIATFVMLGWGVNTTFSQLMLAITVVLSGILLGARAAIITMGLSIAGMAAVQFLVSSGNAPLFTDAVAATTYGDVLGYSAMLSVLALVSALSTKHDRELHVKDVLQQQTLAKQKGTLEQRVRGQSQQLKTMQLEEMDQLYKFAEIGQLSAALLHDIAGHLTVLNVDVADLKQKQGAQTVGRLQESIDYIDEVIGQARTHLQVKDALRDFDVHDCIQDSLKLPHFQESRAAIHVVAPRTRVLLYGESLRLSHVLTVLIRNAIEAYPAHTPRAKREVTIELTTTQNAVIITVSDKGNGIPAEVRENLFTPLRSTKKDGLGLGLYIARKITETHFNGTLALGSDTTHTTFILTLPKARR